MISARSVSSLSAATFLAFAVSSPAHAQGKLEARYGISVAGISIGKASWSMDVGADGYTASASGRASGLMSVLVSGEGSVVATGKIADGRPVPATFAFSLTQEGEKSNSKMELDNGAVKVVVAEREKFDADRVPVTAAHRVGVIDPVSALLVPITGAFDVASKEACGRTLPVFDGRRRYDLKLSFKRMDTVKAEHGYAGPVAVCAVTFHPQGGHRASSSVVKYLTEGRDIELWLAPVAGTRLLAPFRASVSSMLGSLVVQATQFDVATRTAAAQPAKPRP